MTRGRRAGTTREGHTHRWASAVAWSRVGAGTIALSVSRTLENAETALNQCPSRSASRPLSMADSYAWTYTQGAGRGRGAYIAAKPRSNAHLRAQLICCNASIRVRALQLREEAQAAQRWLDLFQAKLGGGTDDCDLDGRGVGIRD